MRFLKTLFIQIFLGFITIAVYAQDAAMPAATAAPAAQAEGGGYNLVAILMIIISLVLVFVIYSMGQVLLTLLQQLNEKRKTINIFPAIILFISGSLLSITAKAQEATSVTEEVIEAAPNYGGLSASNFYTFCVVIGLEVVVIFVMMLFINRIKSELNPVVETKKAYDWGALFNKLDKKLFTKAVAVEKEQDIMLEHEYDGIRELDNSLPPWWKYGFIITIIVAGIYLIHFHVLGTGKNPTQEYEAELAQAKIEMDAYAAQSKDKIDESNIQMSDEAGIAEGNEIYQQMCWACHGKLGEGGAGPNLTDKNWIHEGSMNAIYASIKHGYPDKGMQAWEKQYSPKQINHLVSYIKTLQGTNPPNAKEAQGDIWEEAGNAATDAPAGDSSATPEK